jgi:hypothetical protein
MKAPLIDQRLELAILSAVAACGLASIQVTSSSSLCLALPGIITIIEALRRLR